MEIRTCRASEIEDLVALWEACSLTRPWNDPRSDFLLAIRTPTSTVLGGFEKGELVASAMLGFDGHRGWVYYLAVSPREQRRGLGREMMSAASDWLRDLGAPKIQFMVREGNDATLAFYERLGFQRQSVVTLGRRLDGQ